MRVDGEIHLRQAREVAHRLQFRYRGQAAAARLCANAPAPSGARDARRVLRDGAAPRLAQFEYQRLSRIANQPCHSSRGAVWSSRGARQHSSHRPGAPAYASMSTPVWFRSRTPAARVPIPDSDRQDRVRRRFRAAPAPRGPGHRPIQEQDGLVKARRRKGALHPRNLAQCSDQIGGALHAGLRHRFKSRRAEQATCRWSRR